MYTLPSPRFCVLVVDDEPGIRRFAARTLLDEGFAVLEAADGAEALERTRAGGVDAVVSDVVMPELNGVELMAALAVSHPRLPVLLMSGYAVADLAARGIEAPCGLLLKPFTARQLVEEVRRCLDGRAEPEVAAGPEGMGD